MAVVDMHQDLRVEVAAERERLGALVERLDPDEVPATQAPALWQEFDRIGRVAAAAKALLARRVEDSHRWAGEGFASPAEFLAAKGGTSLAAARGELEMSKALPSLPVVREGLVAGTVSAQQGALIADAAQADPSAQRALVQAAQRDSFRELRDRAQRVKVAADPSPEHTQRRIHQARRLREFVDAEGAWNLSMRGTVADGAKVHAALQPVIEQRFRHDRSAATHDLGEARAFDAMVELVTRPTDGGPTKPGRYLGLIRCDLTALRRGAVRGGEVCEIAGLGPVPVHLAVELLGEATWKLILTKGVDVANVTTLSRKATAAMLAALQWRSPVCSVEGCGRTITQIDHRVPWAQTRHTRLPELDPLCPHDHRLKTHDGWELVEGSGVRPFVPPHDPRHPNHRHRSTRAGPDPP